MTTLRRDNLREINSAEAFEWMSGGGFTVRSVSVSPEGTTVDADGDEAALRSRLDAFVPTPDYKAPVPQGVRDAVGRLRVRANGGDAVARDCLILFRYLNGVLD